MMLPPGLRHSIAHGWASAVLCVALSAPAFAKDPNQPVRLGSAEFSGGASYARYTGSFNNGSHYHAYPDSLSPAAMVYPLRIRLGLGKGFEVRGDWSYASTNKDLGDKQGMTQPSFSLRYWATNFGAFNNWTLPVAPGDFDNGDLHTAVEIGGMTRWKSPHTRFTGLVSYVDDFDQNEILRVWVKPEILWRPSLSTFVTGECLRGLGKGAHGAYLASLGPGLRADFSEALGLEVTAPFSVAGRNSPVAGWSLSVRGLWTIKY